MTKRDKLKVKKLRMEKRKLLKKFSALENFAANAQDNMSTPPEPDDWLYADEISGYCKEMEEVNDRLEEIDELLQDLTGMRPED